MTTRSALAAFLYFELRFELLLRPLYLFLSLFLTIIDEHEMLLTVFVEFLGHLFAFIVLKHCRLGLAELLAFVEHGAVALVFSPLAPENFNERLLFIETRIFLKDSVVFVLVQPDIFAALMPATKTSLSFIIM